MKKKENSLRDRLRNRTKENIKNKEGGGNKKNYLDFSKIDREVEFYKPKAKTNLIDIIPYKVSTNNHPSFEKGAEDYLLDIWMHYNIGINNSSVVCLKKNYSKPCPICEEIGRLISEGNKKEAEKLYAKRRCIYNVIDLNGEDDTIKIFDVSHFLFEKEMLEEVEMLEERGEDIVFSDPEEGKSIRFRGADESFENDDGTTASFLKYKSFSFKDREPYSKDIVEEAFSLDGFLVVLSYKEINDLFFGIDGDGIEDDEEEERIDEEKEDPIPKNRKNKTKRKKEEENKCPNNHLFGDDCDEYDECTDCNIWDECSDEYDKNEK